MGRLFPAAVDVIRLPTLAISIELAILFDQTADLT